jgi:hypothetical protein
MIREQARAKCIEAMAIAECKLGGEEWSEITEKAREDYRSGVRPLFDALHGIAVICMPNVTIDMEAHRYYWSESYLVAFNDGVATIIAGDLTNPLDKVKDA